MLTKWSRSGSYLKREEKKKINKLQRKGVLKSLFLEGKGKTRTKFFSMKLLITFNKMATVYKYAACLQRLCRLHFANIFYRRKVCTGWFSTHLLFLFHQTQVLRKHQWTEDQKKKTDRKRAMLGHLRATLNVFPLHMLSQEETFFILQVIMRTSQHLKEISSLKSICLVISLFANMWDFFSIKQVHHLSHTWKGSSNKECLQVHYLAQLFARCEAVFWLACML